MTGALCLLTFACARAPVATANDPRAPARVPVPPPAPADASAAASNSAARAAQNLYDRLGGKPAVEAVVSALLEKVKVDERINARFALADMEQVQRKLSEQICQLAGGPCRYSGRPMKELHLRMGIRNREFDALVQDLAETLDSFRVPPPEQRELLSALAGLRSQIVELD